MGNYPFRRICFYDENESFISYLDTPTKTFATPSNARYLKFCVEGDYGTTYNHDICINISNASLNGQYKPYVAPRKIDLVALGLTQAQRTLRSAGSVRDYFEIAENDGAYELTITRRIMPYTFLSSIVDTAWTANGNYYQYTLTSSLLGNAIKGSWGYIAIISDKLNAATQANLYSNGNTLTDSICVGDNGLLGISQDLYADKSKLIGATIYVELATPSTTTLIDDLTFDQASLPIELGGHFEVHNANESYGALPSLTTQMPVKKYEPEE